MGGAKQERQVAAIGAIAVTMAWLTGCSAISDAVVSRNVPELEEIDPAVVEAASARNR